MVHQLGIVQRSPEVRVASFRSMDDEEMATYADRIASLSPSVIRIVYSLEWLELCALKCIDHPKCVLFRLVFSTDVTLLWCVFFKAAKQ